LTTETQLEAEHWLVTIFRDRSAVGDRVGVKPPDLRSRTGAGDRNRTRNLLFTKQLLCQLSYAGASGKGKGRRLRGTVKHGPTGRQSGGEEPKDSWCFQRQVVMASVAPRALRAALHQQPTAPSPRRRQPTGDIVIHPRLITKGRLAIETRVPSL
jgi:hypothetical protein